MPEVVATRCLARTRTRASFQLLKKRFCKDDTSTASWATGTSILLLAMLVLFSSIAITTYPSLSFPLLSPHLRGINEESACICVSICQYGYYYNLYTQHRRAFDKQADRQTNIPTTCLSTYIPAYVYIRIHTYIHTYVHTYTHTYP